MEAAQTLPTIVLCHNIHGTEAYRLHAHPRSRGSTLHSRWSQTWIWTRAKHATETQLLLTTYDVLKNRNQGTLQSSISRKLSILSLTADFWVNLSITLSMATCYFGYIVSLWQDTLGISGWSRTQGGSSTTRSAPRHCSLTIVVFTLYQRYAEPCAHWDSLSTLCWWYPVIPSSEDDICSGSATAGSQAPRTVGCWLGHGLQPVQVLNHVDQQRQNSKSSFYERCGVVLNSVDHEKNISEWFCHRTGLGDYTSTTWALRLVRIWASSRGI